MYEFLAPWGVFVPALTAAMSYFLVKHLQRCQARNALEAPASLALIFGADMIFVDEL